MQNCWSCNVRDDVEKPLIGEVVKRRNLWGLTEHLEGRVQEQEKGKCYCLFPFPKIKWAFNPWSVRWAALQGYLFCCSELRYNLSHSAWSGTFNQNVFTFQDSHCGLNYIGHRQQYFFFYSGERLELLWSFYSYLCSGTGTYLPFCVVIWTGRD